MDGNSKAVVYLRVSTVEQADKGMGLAIQLQACRERIELDGLTVVTVLRDEGVSGAESIENRVGLMTALNALQAGEADTLVVYRLDRLARDIILQETVLRQVWTAGASVVTCSPMETSLCRPDLDDEDPARTLVRQILGAVSQYEKSMIRLRMRGGRRRAARERVFSGGQEPFGWVADKSTRVGLREVWIEQATLARAKVLHDVEGLPWAAVAAQLNMEGSLRRDLKWWDAQQIRRVVASDARVRAETAKLPV